MGESKEILLALHCINKAKSQIEATISLMGDSCSNHDILASQKEWVQASHLVSSVHGYLSILSEKFGIQLRDHYDPRINKTINPKLLN